MCFVISTREACYMVVDSLGQFWTSHLPNAIGWTTKEAADRYIARSFSPAEIERLGIQSQDVTSWDVQPRRVIS